MHAKLARFRALWPIVWIGLAFPVVTHAQISSDAYYQLINTNSELALAVWWARTVAGVEAIQWTDCGQEDTYWRFIPGDADYYYLENKRSGLYLGINLSGGGALTLQAPPGTGSADHLLWRPTPTGDGTYRLTNRQSGRSMAVAGQSPDRGAKIEHQSHSGRSDVSWRLETYVAATPDVSPAPHPPVTSRFMPQSGAAPRWVKLYTWYSEGRTEHFTTSDPRWSGVVGNTQGGYVLIRIEGRVLAPDAEPLPGTVPLYSFWSPERRDNFLTSNPDWISQERRYGYDRYRLEGYAFAQPLANTLPLASYWNGTQADNHATTALRTGESSYRTEGYILPAAPEDEERSEQYAELLKSIGFGHRRPRLSDTVDSIAAGPGGYRYTAVDSDPVSIPLILMGQEFSDLAFSASDVIRYRAMLAPTPPSLAVYMQTAANGMLNWEPRDFVGPVREWVPLAQLERDRDIYAALSDSRCGPFDTGGGGDRPARVWSQECLDGLGLDLAAFDLNGDGFTSLDELDPQTRQLIHLDIQGVDFSRFDRDGDGRVGDAELQVLRFGADPGARGTWEGRPSRDIYLDGVTVKLKIPLVNKDMSLQNVAHELMHVWDGEDLYGVDEHNRHASLMAAHTRFPYILGDDPRFTMPDPWHALQWAWTRPRFHAVGGGPWVTNNALFLRSRATTTRDELDARPILFFDPERGLSEYFLLEYRALFPKCAGSGLPESACSGYPDSAVQDHGVAVWHYYSEDPASFTPLVLSKGNDTDGRFAWSPLTPPESQTPWLAVVNPPDGLLGRNDCQTVFWRREHGPFELRWKDGSSAGVEVSVGPADRASPAVVVQWSPLVFQPRIDRLQSRSVRLAAGETVAIEGVFGIREPFTVIGLVEATAVWSDFVELPVIAWSNDRLLGTIPVDMAPGRYALFVGAAHDLRAGRLDRMSNPVHIEIVAP